MNDTLHTYSGKGKRFGKASLLLRLVARIFAAAVLLSLFSILVLHIPAVQKEIIVRVEKQLETATHYKMEVASFTWWPLSSLQLKDVRVKFESEQVLECKQVLVSYTITTGSPYLSLLEIYLEQPFVHLERTADGTWRVPGLAAQALDSGAGKLEERVKGDHCHERVPLWKLKIYSGHIEAHQQGKTVMTVKDVTGILRLFIVQGPNGPEVRADFD